MKTIKQIADELKVSKETIRQQAAKLAPRLVTVGTNRTKFILDEGVAIIKKNVLSSSAKQVPTNGANEVPTMALVKMLEAELEIKNEQIKNLSTMLMASQGLHAGTIQYQLTDGKKQSLFSKIFKRKSSDRE